MALAGPVQVAYEAGPTGFRLARTIIAAGMGCVVVAPSKLQRPVCDRVKTDAKDAAHLAKLLRLGELVAVTLPDPDRIPKRPVMWSVRVMMPEVI